MVNPTPPTSVPRTGARVTCVWGAGHPLLHGGLYKLCQPGSEPRVALFPRLLGHSHRPPPPQVHLGPSRRVESGNACPCQPFQETFPSHAGPRSAGDSFATGRLRAPRTWPESADLGTLRGGNTWSLQGSSMRGEDTPVPMYRANPLPVWPHPGRATWHLGPVPLWTHRLTPRVLERAGEPGKNKTGGGGGNCRFLLVKILSSPN